MFRHLVLFSSSPCAVAVYLSELQPSLLCSGLYYSSTSLGGGTYSSTEAPTKLLWIPPHGLGTRKLNLSFLINHQMGIGLRNSYTVYWGVLKGLTIRLFLGRLVPEGGISPRTPDSPFSFPTDHLCKAGSSPDILTFPSHPGKTLCMDHQPSQ